MRPDDPNLPILILIAEALGDLREDLVFVGGCAAGLLLTDPAAEFIRATADVDAIVEAASLRDYYKVEARLPGKGFARDHDSNVICRWKHRATGTQFDLMPVDPEVLGFSNIWYPEAVRTAERVRLREDLEIRLIAAPAFMASKFEAFRDPGRGKGDYLESHDLEDVLIVLEGRPSLPEEIAAAPEELRMALRNHLQALLDDANFKDVLPGLLGDYESPYGERVDVVLERMQQIVVLPDS